MQTDTTTKDMPGTIIAALMIVLGAVAWWDTTSMEDSDSFVFPRAIIVAMVVFSLLLILFNLVRPRVVAQGEQQGGSHRRRVLLVGVMLGGAAIMPYLGFILSGLLVFGALIGIAMYDPWTRFRTIVYPLTGIAIVAGFYLLFAELLLVPLPLGLLFE